MSGTDIRPAELEISRSNVAVTAKGFVTSFHQGSRFEYEAGEATLIESEVTGMKGEDEITWAATQVKDPRDSIVEKLKLPLSIPFPIQVGARADDHDVQGRGSDRARLRAPRTARRAAA